MKYITPLSEDELKTLSLMHKYHPVSRVRGRAHILLLSHQRYQMKEIAAICQVTRQTVSIIIDAWEQRGLSALYDLARSGGPRRLTPEEEQLVIDLLKKEPRSAKKVIARVKDQTGKQVSRSTVKRIIKRSRQSWKRIRKSLKSKRNEQEFRQSQEEIRQLKQKEQEGEIDLFYFDEAGFSLEPSIPYAWQPIGEVIEIPAAKGSRLNVLAFMKADNELTLFTIEGSVNTAVVVACFNEFSKNLQKETYVIIDNAPVHRSKEFEAHIPKWSKLGLNLKFLPPYSPELNLIEILWRKIKYEWLPFGAYLSSENLLNALEYILSNFGSEYGINFAQ